MDMGRRLLCAARTLGIRVGVLGLAAIGMAMPADEAAAAIAYRAASSASATSVSVSGISFLGTGKKSAASGNITVTLPTGIANGDLMLCLVESYDTVTPTITSPTGWTSLYSIASGSTHRASAFYRLATSSSETNPTINHSGGSSIVAACSAFRGVNTTSPFDVAYASSAAATSSGGSTIISTGSLSTVTANSLILIASHNANDATSLSVTTTGGLGWTIGTSYPAYLNGSGSADVAVGLHYATKTTVGSIGPLSVTSNASGVNTGVVLALRPANTSGSPVFSLTVPTGTVSGDVMVAAIAVSPSTITLTAPSGWTLIRNQLQNTSGTGASTSLLATYYKVASGSEPGSYFWTVSSTSINGIVGGVASFSGVDNTTPVDVSASSATPSSRYHVAPSITTTQSNEMLVTVHEYTSSRAWTPPTLAAGGSMTEVVDKSSLTPNNTSGIAMEMNYTPVATAQATSSVCTNTGTPGCRADTGSSTGADYGATQSIALKFSVPLVCFSDTFTDLSNWAVGNQGGTFGNPAIVSGRLRLSSASTQASTWATLQRLFPAAGNKIVVSFQHFAYGGTGADGVGVILSDASQAPQSGAFGGSLGYAPKQTSLGGDTTHVGFAGGWLGFGLDEYGNYSSDTEGRNSTGVGLPAAPGVTADAVAIRGSGTGYTGYGYLKGTGTLSPGLDNTASSTAAPGYYYRITVDHSNGTNAWTTVERDTSGTGTSYSTIIPIFDAKAMANQSSVPTNWYFSFTGATGSSTNTHEIDNLQICSTSQQTLSLHHIRLEYSSSGLTCSPSAVTIKACADASCSSLYLGTTTVSLTPTSGVTWGLASGSPATLSGTSVTFTNGQAQVTLSKTSTGTVNVGGTATSPTTANTTVCSVNGGSEISCSGTSAQITFSSSSSCLFDAVETTKSPATPIYTKLSGTAFNLDVLSLLSGAVNAGYRGTVAVSLVDPNATSGNCTDNNTGLTAATTYTYTAGDSGRKTFAFTYPYAAKEVRVRVRDTSTGQTACSNDNFAIRPSQFSLAVTPASLLSGGTYAAGTDFTLTADTGVTQGYLNAAPLLDYNKITDQAGASSSSSLLTGSFSPVTSGSGAGSVSGTFQYLDVGTLTFAARSGVDNSAGAVFDNTFTAVDSAKGECVVGSSSNTLTSGLYGCTIGTTGLGPLGRFRPDHYEVTAWLNGSCNQSTSPIANADEYVYMGDNELDISLVVNAMPASSSGSTTPLSRYTSGYSNLAPLTVSVDNNGTVLTSRLDMALPAASTSIWSLGTYTGTDGNHIIARAASPDGAYDNLRLKLFVNDTDNVLITKLNGQAVSPGSATVYSNPVKARYGRMRLLNAYGSELLPIQIPVQVEYYDGSVWKINSLDNCTTISDVSTALAMGNYKGTGFSSNNVDATNLTPGPLTLTGGIGSISIIAPNPSQAGSLDVALNLGATTQDASCVGTTLSPTTGEDETWLRYAWCSGGQKDPSARITFGASRAPYIYLREKY